MRTEDSPYLFGVGSFWEYKKCETGKRSCLLQNETMRLQNGKDNLSLSLRTRNAQRVFHVHTWRCGHAARNPDRDYVERAVHLGAKEIWFTDHAPFPGDPFGGRMPVGLLVDYQKSLQALAEEYEGIIRIIPGLETEYFPGMENWYDVLQGMGFVLLLGQHMYRLPGGGMNFSLPDARKKREEADGIVDALIQGMGSGYFIAVAHPDRAFRYRKDWTAEETRLAEALLTEAETSGLPVEDNLSCRKNGQYRPELWALAEPKRIDRVCGLDAHSPEEIILWGGT